MVSTSVASAAPAGATDVFRSSNENTIINMSQQEMAATQGEFGFTAGLTLASLFAAGVATGLYYYNSTH